MMATIESLIMNLSHAPLLVLCSFPDEESARRISTGLLEKQLAACVGFSTTSSLYRWQGAIESATETIARIKTTALHFPALQAYILAHHPYQVPEIIGLPINEISPAYLDWLLESLSKTP